MRAILLQIILSIGLIVLATAIGHRFDSSLGITGIVMLHLAVALLAAYYFRFPVALFTAFASFTAINFFQVEPRYTFEISDLDSWVALTAFLLVSIVVASLVRRLRNQTEQSTQARARAEFSQRLAEHLAAENEPEKLLETSAKLIADYLREPVAFSDITGVLLCKQGTFNIAPDPHAIRWAVENGRPIGPGTINWADLGFWIIPFERMPSKSLALIIQVGANENIIFHDLRGLTDQVSIAYTRLLNRESLRSAELHAHDEALRNALLASLSHDMRTPLTAILGAATTLVSQKDLLSAQEQERLLVAIAAEARYMTQSTENILAMARLRMVKEEALNLDWQSPEEIIGTLLSRYRQRPLKTEIQVKINTDALVLADAIMLSQALANLLDNALDAHLGTEPILIDVNEATTGISISVHDRGAGFPTNWSVDKIDKFSRNATSGKGFGLGLAIVKTIAELHDVMLEMQPRTEGGTTMRLFFTKWRPTDEIADK